MKSACAGLLGMGLADGVAQAFEIDEATSPLVTDGDFDDAFPGEALPAGVTSIVGTNSTSEPGPEDYFQLTGLNPGGQLAIALSGATGNYSLRLFDSAGARLSLMDIMPPPGESIVGDDGSGSVAQGMGTVGATIPGDGIVIGNASPVEGGAAYTLSIVPEPATGALAAMGAAALLGIARRKQD